MAAVTVPISRGVLITTDEQTVVYLLVLDEQTAPSHRFVIRKLDATHVFVRESRLAVVNAALQRRLMQTVYTEEDEAAEPAS